MRNTEPVLFTDDTNLFSSGSDAISLQYEVTNDLAIIFSAKNKTTPCIYIYKLTGKLLLKFLNKNSWVCLLTLN